MLNTVPDVCSTKHAKYFERFLHLLPARLSSHDSARVTIAFYSLCGLDILDSLHLLSHETKQNIIDWVYRYQVTPTIDGVNCGGFQGSSTLNIKDAPDNCESYHYKWGHLAMTYTGLAILITLGDDLSRLNRKKIIEGVAACQRVDGSFSASVEGNEHDMRFVYCAATICTMLNDWGDVNKESMFDYICKSIRYDNGVSQHFEMEGHGGTTFCAIAALKLSGNLNRLPTALVEKMKRWCIFRQVDGFQGRPNKPVDTCYSFWIGASLKILDAYHLTNFQGNREFILRTQNKVVGGFSKWPDSDTDPFHTYFGLCGLSFMNEPGISQIVPSLNISKRAYERLKELHNQWQLQDGCIAIKLQ